MSNTLFITVGTFTPLDRPEDSNVMVAACDSYGNEMMSFEDTDHLLNCYPTKDDLIAGILKSSHFEGAAIFNPDGTYELDAATAVIIRGYPQ